MDTNVLFISLAIILMIFRLLDPIVDRLLGARHGSTLSAKVRRDAG